MIEIWKKESAFTFYRNANSSRLYERSLEISQNVIKRANIRYRNPSARFYARNTQPLNWSHINAVPSPDPETSLLTSTHEHMISIHQPRWKGSWDTRNNKVEGSICPNG